jgi:riboflavin synthase
MFTGIIQGLGKINEIKALGQEYQLTVEPDFDWDGPLVLGESIAVSGACLTVTESQGRKFRVDVSAETVSRTTMRQWRAGTVVNLERALKLSDRLGGHLVTGHVDGLAQVTNVTRKERSLVFQFKIEQDLAKYVIEKGSVAVDGISLTVNEASARGFSINVIPHTVEATTLGFKKQGDYVNLETDLIGKYVARFLGKTGHGDGIDEKFLAEHGFL